MRQTTLVSTIEPETNETEGRIMALKKFIAGAVAASAVAVILLNARKSG